MPLAIIGHAFNDLVSLKMKIEQPHSDWMATMGETGGGGSPAFQLV